MGSGRPWPAARVGGGGAAGVLGGRGAGAAVAWRGRPRRRRAGDGTVVGREPCAGVGVGDVPPDRRRTARWPGGRLAGRPCSQPRADPAARCRVGAGSPAAAGVARPAPGGASTTAIMMTMHERQAERGEPRPPDAHDASLGGPRPSDERPDRPGSVSHQERRPPCSGGGPDRRSGPRPFYPSGRCEPDHPGDVGPRSRLWVGHEQATRASTIATIPMPIAGAIGASWSATRPATTPARTAHRMPTTPGVVTNMWRVETPVTLTAA